MGCYCTQRLCIVNTLAAIAIAACTCCCCFRSKGYQWMFDVPLTKSSIRQSIKQRAESGRFGVVVSEDVSEGLEKVSKAREASSLSDQYL